MSRRCIRCGWLSGHVPQGRTEFAFYRLAGLRTAATHALRVRDPGCEQGSPQGLTRLPVRMPHNLASSSVTQRAEFHAGRYAQRGRTRLEVGSMRASDPIQQARVVQGLSGTA